MTQLSLFRARKERDKGIALVSRPNAEFLDWMRYEARRICLERGTVTIDDLRGGGSYPTPTHYNAYGAIFHHPDFECTGFTVSKQVQGHGNLIRVWRLKPE